MTASCDWAACHDPATTREDGWLHCARHLHSHRTDTYPDAFATYGRPNAAQCGTVSGYKAHLRRGEITCPACLAATRAAYKARRAVA